MVTEPRPLFAGHDLVAMLRSRREAMKAEIQRLDEAALAGDEAKLKQDLERKYRIEPLLLGSVTEIVEHGDVVLNLTGSSKGALYKNRSRVKGRRFVFGIPFQGDRQFFDCRPSTWAGTPPIFIVGEKELRVVIRTVSDDAAAMRRKLDSELDNVRQHVAWITEDLRRYNASTGALVERWVGERRKELGEKAGVVAAFGMKVRLPKVAPAAGPAPAVAPERPRRGPGVDHYSRILEKILGAARVMERNAASFRKADECMLRDVVIAALGAEYPTVTSETKSGDGRTDILVQGNKGGTLFIGECKKWHGRDALIDGINQLLGYASWRDRHLGLIFFVGNRKVSVVLEIIEEALPRHPQFKSALPEESREGVLRYVFEQRDDPGCEAQLAVVLLHLPGEMMKAEAPNSNDAPEPPGGVKSQIPKPKSQKKGK